MSADATAMEYNEGIKWSEVKHVSKCSLRSLCFSMVAKYLVSSLTHIYLVLYGEKKHQGIGSAGNLHQQPISTVNTKLSIYGGFCKGDYICMGRKI